MTTPTAASLAAQRLILRRRLHAQRQVIAQQLGPRAGSDGGFPRSITMRFLVRRSALVLRLLSGLATALIAR